MNKIILIFLLLCVSHTFNAQTGFNRVYSIEDASCTFQNIFLQEDTIILTGIILAEEDSLQKWSVLFVKADTLGNILDYKIHPHTEDDWLLTYPRFTSIKTSTNDYAVVGNIFLESDGFLLILDGNGNLKNYYQTVFDEDTFFGSQSKVIETNNGYWLGGTFSPPDANSKSGTYILKINFDNEIQWEQNYFEQPYHYFLEDLEKINNNLLIKTASYLPNVDNQEDAWGKVTITGLDSLGNELWQWENDELNHTGIYDINQNNTNGWIYSALRFEAISSGSLAFHPKLISRDSDFNLLWERYLSDTTILHPKNRVNEIEPTTDNAWLGVGTWHTRYSDFTEETYQGGCLYKISENGDSIWSRCDTIVWNEAPYTSKDYFNAAVVLPSGSIIAAGHSERGNQNYGWLVKVNKDGCLDEDPCPTPMTNVVEEVREREVVKVFPNPAAEYVFFEWTTPPLAATEIKVYNIVGQLVWQSTKARTNPIEWRTSGLANGLYFYEIRQEQQLIQMGNVVVQP